MYNGIMVVHDVITIIVLGCHKIWTLTTLPMLYTIALRFKFLLVSNFSKTFLSFYSNKKTT